MQRKTILACSQLTLCSKGNHRNIMYGNQNIRHSIRNHSIDGITVTIPTTHTLAMLIMLVITVVINVCRSTCKGPFIFV